MKVPKEFYELKGKLAEIEYEIQTNRIQLVLTGLARCRVLLLEIIERVKQSDI